MDIDDERLLRDLYTLRQIGADGIGVVRPSFSAADMEARRWLVERMTDAGLDAGIDGTGNVFGRSPNPGRPLLVGSHSDTQLTGGWLDGALGVICGLEVARSCLEDPETGHLPVDVVAWVDEESQFVSCLGSRTFCGLIGDTEIATAANPAGVTLVDAWRAAGLDGTSTISEPGRYLGYLEAHIEQGANLERDGNRIGVVTSIAGSRSYQIEFSGQQNHAGTTPMEHRRDAGMALIRFARAIDEEFQRLAGPLTVWTIGRVAFHPGAASIVPGEADMQLQLRDPETDRLEAFERAVDKAIGRANDAGPVSVKIGRSSSPIDPAAMDRGFRSHLATAADRLAPGRWVLMPSAAVHDAMFLATAMPSAMLFVPSIDGISHDFAENTSDEDIVLGCRVLAAAVESILTDAARQNA